MKTLPVTFQDKVYQARQLEGLVQEHELSQAVSKMLTEVTLKEVSPGTCTTVVSVAKYSVEEQKILDEIFDNFERAAGAGKSIPVKLFRLLQGSVLQNERKMLLLKARDEGISVASTFADDMKKRKIVQNNVATCLNAKNWEEARTNYPSYTSDAVLDMYKGLRMQNNIPRPLLDFLNKASEDETPPVQPDKLTIKLEIKYKGVDVYCPEIKRKYEEKIRSNVLSHMLKQRKISGEE